MVYLLRDHDTSSIPARRSANAAEPLDTPTLAIMTKKEDLVQALEELGSQRHALMARLAEFPEDKLIAPAADGGWSVAQVITHLAIAEEGSLVYLRKKLEFGKHGPVSFSSHWRLFLLNAALASPFKFKAPAIVAEIPLTSFSEAELRWASVRRSMLDTYLGIPEEHIDHDLFKHPSLGKFNLLQAMRFMRVHCARHIGQIDRILENANV